MSENKKLPRVVLFVQEGRGEKKIISDDTAEDVLALMEKPGEDGKTEHYFAGCSAAGRSREQLLLRAWYRLTCYLSNAGFLRGAAKMTLATADTFMHASERLWEEGLKAGVPPEVMEEGPISVMSKIVAEAPPPEEKPH